MYERQGGRGGRGWAGEGRGGGGREGGGGGALEKVYPLLVPDRRHYCSRTSSKQCNTQNPRYGARGICYICHLALTHRQTRTYARMHATRKLLCANKCTLYSV